MRRAVLGALSLVLVTAGAEAKPKRKTPALKRTAVHASESAAASYFLAADPHVPLAVVRAGKVQPAVPSAEHGKSCGKASRWATEGSRWHALDAWGRFTGVATVEVAEPYDVTTCSELYFAPKFDRHTEATLFVSEDSEYVPGPSLEWRPAPNAHWTFQASLSKLPTSGRRQVPYRCSDVPKAIRYFQAGGAKLAVGGTDGALRIAAWNGTSWSTEYADQGSEKTPMCYRPVSVFDLDADGRPEVVVREVFGAGEGWRDVVLTRDADGHWHLVAASPGGSTA